MSNKKQIDVQSLLQQAARNKALIGLENIIQYEDRNGTIVFKCTLCDVKVTPSELIRHVTGSGHRTIYLKNYKLEIYEEIYRQSRSETHYEKLLELEINNIMQQMGGFHKFSNIEIVKRTRMDTSEQHRVTRSTDYIRKDSLGQDIPATASLQLPPRVVTVTISNEQHGLMKRTNSRRKDFDSQSIEASINILVQHSEINEVFASKMTHNELRQLYAVALEKRALEKRIARLNRMSKCEGFTSHNEHEELSDSYSVISREYAMVLNDVHRRLNKEEKEKMAMLSTENDDTIVNNLQSVETEGGRQTSSSSSNHVLDYNKLAVKLPPNLDKILQHVSDWESEQKNLRYKGEASREESGGSGKHQNYHHQSEYQQQQQQQQGKYKYDDDDAADATYNVTYDDVPTSTPQRSSVKDLPTPQQHLSVIASQEQGWNYDDNSYQYQQQMCKNALLPISTSSPIPRFDSAAGGPAGDGYYGGVQRPKGSAQYPDTKQYNDDGGAQAGLSDYESNQQYWRDEEVPPSRDHAPSNYGSQQQQYDDNNYYYGGGEDYNYPYDGDREQRHGDTQRPSTGSYQPYSDQYQQQQQRYEQNDENEEEYDYYGDKKPQCAYNYVDDVTMPASRKRQAEESPTVRAVQLKESLQMLKRKITMETRGHQLAVTSYRDAGMGRRIDSCDVQQQHADDGYEYDGKSYPVDAGEDDAMTPRYSCFGGGGRKRRLDERGDGAAVDQPTSYDCYEERSPKRRAVMMRRPLLSILPKPDNKMAVLRKKVLLPTPNPHQQPSYNKPYVKRPSILGSVFPRPRPPQMFAARPPMNYRPPMRGGPRFNSHLMRPQRPMRSLMTMRVRPYANRPAGFSHVRRFGPPMQRFTPRIGPFRE